MHDSIKNWSNKASEKKRVQNEELQSIQQDGLITVQQIIDRVIADKDQYIAQLQA
jgi:hypothetical protein